MISFSAIIVAIVCLLLSLVGHYIFPRWRRYPSIQTSPEYNKIKIANDNEPEKPKEEKQNNIRWSYNWFFAEYSYLMAVVASFIAIYSTHAYLTRIFFFIHLLRAFWPLLSYQYSQRRYKREDSNGIPESTISSLLYRTLPFFGLALLHVIVEESICIRETKPNGVCYAWFPTDAVTIMGIGFLIWGFGYQCYSHFFSKLRERMIAPERTSTKSSVFSLSRLLTRVPFPSYALFITGTWMLTVSLYKSISISINPNM